MKILVEIDEKKYVSIKKCLESGMELDAWQTAVANGTVLPKGHGRLIDADALESIFRTKGFDKARSAKFYEIVWAQKQVHNAQTILEADKEE